MAKKGRATRIILLIICLLCLLGSVGCVYLYFVSTTHEEKHVLMYLDTAGGDFYSAPTGYLMTTDGKYYKEVVVGKKYGDLPTPAKFGYVFDGWASDALKDEKIGETSKVEFENDFSLFALWKLEATQTYTVNYYNELGESIKDATSGFAKNNTEFTIDVPKILGYTFDSESSVITKTIGSNTVFDLYYLRNDYTIRYSIASLGIVYEEHTDFKYGQSINLLPFSKISANDARFNLPGMQFKRWQVGVNTLDDSALITPSDLEQLGFGLDLTQNAVTDLSLNAIYEKKRHNLQLVVQGAVFDTISYEYGSQINAPTDPSVDGYRFVNWFTGDTGATGKDIVGNIVYDFSGSYMPDSDVTLYAGFELIEYSIRYDLRGGELPMGATNREIYTIEDDFVLAEPSLAGKEFIGWTGTDFDTLTTNLRIFNMVGNREYVANYDDAIFEIHYNLNGGRLPAGTRNPDEYTMSSEEFTLLNPTKEGYEFLGWTGTGFDEPTLEITIPTGSIGTRSYTANFSAIEFSITWKLNGGAFGSGDNQLLIFTVENVEAYAVPKITKRGYNFVGWTWDDEPSVPNDNLVLRLNEILHNFTLVAHFELATYTLTLNLNGGTLADEEPNIIEYTIETADFTLSEPSKVGYNFVGFIGGRYETATKNITIAQGEYAENLVFEAMYSSIIYHIGYELNGGTATELLPTEYTIESGDITLPNLTKDGYIFDDWTSEGNAVPTKDFVIPAKSTGDKYFVAEFTIISYTITLDLVHGLESIYGSARLPDDWTHGRVFTYNAEMETFELPRPILAGYTFEGWTTTLVYEDAYFEIIVTIEKGSSGDRTYYAWFGKDSYSIEYRLSGGEFKQEDKSRVLSKYKLGDASYTPPTPTRMGYTFDGWKLYDENGTLLDGITITQGSTGNRAYEAVWKPNKNTDYYVEHWLQALDGESYEMTSREQKKGETDASVTEHAKDDFIGFSAKNAEITQTIGADGLTKFIFYYDRLQYTLTINCDDGIAISEAKSVYLYGQTARIVGEITTGYRFVGYYEGTTLLKNTVVYTFVMTKDITISAKTDVVEYTITYDVDSNATFVGVNPTTYNIKTPTFTLVNPTLEGAIFKGWILAGAQDTTPNVNVTIEIGSTGNRRYIAVFEDETFEIDYDLQSGTETAGGSYPTQYTRNDEIVPTAPTRLGYIFTGWTLYDENDNKLSLNFIQEGSFGKRKFVANWQARTDIPYKLQIFYMLANGSYSASPDEEKSFVGTTDSVVTPTLEDMDGYTTPILTAQVIAGDGSTIFVARYARMQYIVTLEKDEGIDILTGAQTYYWGASVNITATPKVGYAFAGWSQTAGEAVVDAGAGVAYAFIMPRGNITIRATSTLLTYTINYDLNDGEWEGGINPNITEYTVLMSEDFTVINPTRVGYKFTGWTGEGLSTPQETLVIQAGTVGDRTYVANWEAIKVKFRINIYKLAIDGTTYVLDAWHSEGEEYTGTEINLPPTTYEGFVFNPEKSKSNLVIAGDGSTVFEMYYDRLQYEVELKIDKGVQNVNVEISGTISANGRTFTCYYGADAKFTATLLNYFNFGGWNVDENIVGTDLVYQFVIGAKNYLVIAEASGYKYTITYDLNDGGDVNTVNNNPSIYEHGENMVISPTSRKGYTFLGWQVVGEENKKCLGTSLTINENSIGDITLKAHWGLSDDLQFTYNLIGEKQVEIGAYNVKPITRIPEYVYVSGGKTPPEASSGELGVGYIIVDEEYYLNGNDNVYKVTAIRGGSFDEETGKYSLGSYTYAGGSIQSIFIPKTIETIGKVAFMSSGLTTVEFESGSPLSILSSASFYGCSSLNSIALPSALAEIKPYALAKTNLQGIILPNILTAIGRNAFDSCNNLTHITLPDSLATMGERVFSSCTKLSSVDLGKGIGSIPNYAFFNCGGLTSITIPSQIKSIGEGAFYYAENLRNVTFNEGLENIDKGAFQKAILSSITLPSSLKTIGESAFYGMTTLESVTFAGASNLTTIGDSVFSYCFNLKTANVPDSVLEIGNYAFSNCRSLTETGLSNSSQLKRIGECAFQQCISLIAVTIPATCTIWGAEPFNLCYKLRQVTTTLAIDNAKLSNNTCANVEIGSASSFTGVISKLGNGIATLTSKTDSSDVSIIGYFGDKTNLDLSSLTNIKFVAPYAFYGDKKLRSIKLPLQIVEVKSYAFADTQLERIMWQCSTSGSKTMATTMIAGSYKLVQFGAPFDESLMRSNGVVIDSKAIEIINTDNTTSFTNTSFSTNGDYRILNVASGEYAGSYLYEYLGTSSEVDLTGHTNLYSGLFSNNQTITSVKFGDGITEIADGMFADAYNLQNVELVSSITKIGKEAFTNDVKLENVNLGDLVDLLEIGSLAFEMCLVLNNIEIGAKVTVLQEGTFRGCFNLSNLVLHEGLLRIENYALQALPLPSNFALPSSVTYIADNAFKDCSNFVPPFTGEKTI